MQWPPYSPNLSPCDFFLWGYLKNQVYKNRAEYNDVERLKATITREFENVPQAMIQKAVTRSFMSRLAAVSDTGGNQVSFLVENEGYRNFN